MQLHSDSLNLYYLFFKVRKKLSEVSAGYWADIEIYSALNDAQKHIAVKSKCLKRTATITTTASTQTYDLNSTTNGFTDIIDIAEDGAEFKISGSKWHPLDFTKVWKLNKESPGWRNVSASVPQKYYYDKSTKVIGLHPKPNSTNAGAYLYVTGYHKPKILLGGTANAGDGTTMTFAAGSTTVPYPSPVNDYYNDLYIEIYSGTGAGERAKITDYVGSTRKATIDFTTNPDSTSVFGMVPQIPSEAHELMWLYAMADLLEKGGSRTLLANTYMKKYWSGLSLFTDQFNEDDAETIEKDTYR